MLGNYVLPHKRHGRKNTAYKSLLIVFNTASVNLSVFFNKSPGITLPHAFFTNRNNIHVGAYPYRIVILQAGKSRNHIGPKARAHPFIWSVVVLDILDSVFQKPFFQSLRLFAFSVPTVFGSKCGY